jgi:anaerobic magnesium-protoporphyrin IX monomethyl ester cyclase
MKLDCAVIGYNDALFPDLLDRLEPYKNVTAAYEHMIAQSVMLKGKRLKYSELINACISHSREEECNFSIFCMPSLGVSYLVNFLLNKGIKATPIQYFNNEKKQLKNLLINEDPTAIAISTSYYYEPEPIIEIITFIRKYNPETTIIVGGTYVNNIKLELTKEQQDWIFQKIGADIYIHDLQGELTLSQVCIELRKDSPQLKNIPNLIYKSKDEFKRTKKEAENNNLNDHVITHLPVNNDYPIPAVFTRTSRSCPNECSFCRYPLLGGEYSLMELSSVEKELDYYHSLGIKYLVFVDDTLNIPLDRFKDICRLLIRKNYKFEWFSYFRCSDADNEAFDLMAEAGCTGVFLGIESGDPTVLKNMNKNATVDQYKYGIKQLNSRSILTLASFMVGFPGETQETALNTIRFIEETQPTFYSLQVYFHELKVPIAMRKNEFSLKGCGYGWSHNTMNWKEASRIVHEGYKTISNSTILPLYSFNIWSLAYYMSLGITKNQLLHFTKSASKMLTEGLKGNANTPSYKKLEDCILSIFKTA